MSLRERVRNGITARLVVPAVPRMPAWLAYGLAIAYVDLRRGLNGVRTKEIALCLNQVMGPDPEGKNYTRVIRDYYRSVICVKLDSLRLAGKGGRLMQFVDISGKEHLRKALAGGKGAILCTGHFGSVRAGAGMLGALGFPITLVADWTFTPDSSQRDSLSKAIVWRPIRPHLRRENILVNSWDRVRGSLAVALQAAEVIRRNEIIMTNVDTGSGGNGFERSVRVDFMGAQAPVLPGPIELARFTGAPILTVLVRRSRDWRHLSVTIQPVEGNDVGSLQECLTRLEKAIRENPAQWELWKMSRLVRLKLYPANLAAEFYRKNYGWWDKDLSEA
jgi:KDO2-lipid IV(A) lauroyltransferase